jgi:hypothetical protein
VSEYIHIRISDKKSRAETSVLKPQNYVATDNDAVRRALEAASTAAQ